jgi:murein L,D-transpeptidase YcbB/YkuD
LEREIWRMKNFQTMAKGAMNLAGWVWMALLMVQAAPGVHAEAVGNDIQKLLQSGKHPNLRWGKFSDVAKTLSQLYGQLEPVPLWVRDGQPTPQAKVMVEALARADDEGLNAVDYDAELLAKWLARPELKSGDPASVAAFDVALSVAATRYVANVYLGRINPRAVGFGLNVEPKRLDVPKRVRDITQSPHPASILATLEPHFPIYRPLKEALLRYRHLAREVPRMRFGFPLKFTPGMSHKDVPALRKLLVAVGDLEGLKPGTENLELYDEELARAVKAYQIRHGLGDDAVIGKATLARLSTPIADRLKQIQLGLERLRWLPASVHGLYLIVNIPSFKLYGAKAGAGLGQHELQMNVVVGEAIDGRTTPVFHSDMTTVTFRPYWNVPEGIAARELVPAIARDRKYLAKNAMEIVPNFSLQAAPLEPSNANLDKLAAGILKIRQKPGSKNALGLVKFSFPNTNNVYLHSTPSQSLFNRDRRDFSHGCIRVQDPLALAEWVLADNGDWSKERIQEYMQGGATKTINIKKPVPVYILYSTVMTDPDGRVSFFEDIYGHDRTLQVLLSRGFPYP